LEIIQKYHHRNIEETFDYMTKG
jgi:NADH:ubiquinone reductase (H+-translocating)